MDKEFQDIGHCGGQFSVTTKTENGRRLASFGIRHSRPSAVALFGIYALPQGIPVGVIEVGGIGRPWNDAPTEDCLPVFIASDSRGLFGHECRKCQTYWRSEASGIVWPMTCPYCGCRGPAHMFLTKGQIEYVREFCAFVEQAIASGKDGTFVMDMDRAADEIAAGAEKPKFYYVEESQQNKFKCGACDASNDILGRYGYCSSCGTRNNLQEVDRAIEKMRERLNGGSTPDSALMDCVTEFDSAARDLTKQLVARVPILAERRAILEKMKFHNLNRCSEQLKNIFGINIFEGLNADQIKDVVRAFHRRHVYEHNGGEVDQKYIDDSGDTTVRLKQSLHETVEGVHGVLSAVLKMIRVFHEGFHELFMPEAEPVRLHTEHLERIRASRQSR